MSLFQIDAVDMKETRKDILKWITGQYSERFLSFFIVMVERITLSESCTLKTGILEIILEVLKVIPLK